MTTTSRPSRGWSYLGLILGGLVSVAANIAHSFIAPKDAPADWSPEPGAVVSSIVWPLFLFIAIEILARTPWPTGWGWNVLRWVGLPPVALVAAFVSYRHLSGLLDHYNEETLVVWFGPLAVDGLMLMATAALLATKNTRPTELVPAPAPATTAEAPSTDIPASPLVRPAAATPATNPTPTHEPAPTALPTSGEDTDTPTTVEPTPDTTETDPTPAPTAAAAAAPKNGPAPALLPGARIIATAHEKTHGEPITAGQLAVRLRVPTTTAADILTALNNPTAINDRPHNGTAVGATA